MGQKILHWALAVLLALIFLPAGLPKILNWGGMAARFEAWGYPAYLAVVVGVVEVAGGILVLIPRTAFPGALALSMVMCGAVFTHLRSGIGSPLFALIALGLAVGLALLTRPAAGSARP